MTANRQLLAILAAALSACATPPNYEAALRPWAGAREAELVRAWGPPTRAYEANGRRFIVYESRRNIHIPAAAPASVGSSSAIDVELSCTTTFELQDLKVVSWGYAGNDCSARRGAPYR